jgi:cation transport ATPase
MKPAAKKYLKDLFIAFFLYSVVLIGGQFLLKMQDLAFAFQVVIALMPMLPVLLVIRAILAFSRSWDELQRKKAMEATLISFTFVGFATFSYGFLEGVGLPKMPTFVVFPAQMFFFSVGQFYAAWKYR